MADTKTYTPNYNLVKPGQDDFYNVDDFNSNADKIDDALHQHATKTTLDHPDNSVTDAKIGDRTLNDTTVANATAGPLTTLLSKIGYMIKSITGKANWYTAPATTLEAAKAHIDAEAPHIGHAPAKFGLGTFAEPLQNINIDIVTACGFYLAYNNCTNIPSTEGHYLLVESLNASYIKQTATNMSTGVIKVRFRVNGTWYGWNQIPTIDLTLTDKSYAPANWNTILTPGVYLVVDDNPTGQTNTAPQALGMYKYGQLVVTMSGSNTSVQQTYYAHTGAVASRQSFDGGSTWIAWKQVSTMDLVAPAKYGIGEYVDASHTITLNATSTKTGFFYYANTDPNRPDSGDGQILVQSFNNTSIKQTAFSWTGTIYQRQYSSSMWSEWKRIVMADSFADYVVAQQLGTNGYTRWASGKLEQWGVLVNVPLAEASPQAVSFNTPYNTGVVPNIVAGIAMASYVSGAISLYVTKGSITNTGFTITGDPSQSSSTGDIHWRSVG